MASIVRLLQKTRNNYKLLQNRPHLTNTTPSNDKRRDPLKCSTCGVKLIDKYYILYIKHILTECRNRQTHRGDTLCSTYLHEILSPDPTAIKNLFIFKKKCNL